MCVAAVSRLQLISYGSVCKGRWRSPTMIQSCERHTFSRTCRKNSHGTHDCNNSKALLLALWGDSSPEPPLCGHGGSPSLPAQGTADDSGEPLDYRPATPGASLPPLALVIALRAGTFSLTVLLLKQLLRLLEQDWDRSDKRLDIPLNCYSVPSKMIVPGGAEERIPAWPSSVLAPSC